MNLNMFQNSSALGTEIKLHRHLSRKFTWNMRVVIGIVPILFLPLFFLGSGWLTGLVEMECSFGFLTFSLGHFSRGNVLVCQ